MTIGPDARAAFERLKAALPGNWRGVRPNGREISVDYRISAAGSALVETWSLAGDVEALTIYHLDGDTLIASHFCPLGNQPRLRLERALADRFDFVFRDATGLGVGDSHQRSFWLELQAGGLERKETYGNDRFEETERVAFRRV